MKGPRHIPENVGRSKGKCNFVDRMSQFVVIPERRIDIVAMWGGAPLSRREEDEQKCDLRAKLTDHYRSFADYCSDRVKVCWRAVP